MSPVGGVPPSGTKAVTNFDKVSQDLIQNSEALRGKAQVAIKKAGDDLQTAGADAGEAALHLVGAGINAGMAAGYAVKSGAEVVGGTAHGAAGVAVGGAGVVVGAGEETLSLTSKVLNAGAKGLTAISNFLTSIIGDGKTATVKEIEGQGKGRLSDKLFGVAGEQFKMSADGYKAAWGSFEQSVGHALGAGVNVAFAAGYTALATADLAQAAARTGQAILIADASVAVAASALGVQAAENGMQGARDLTLLSAKLTAALGRAAATPADADKVQIEVKQAKEIYDAKFMELIKSNPALRELPAAKQYMQLQGAH